VIGINSQRRFVVLARLRVLVGAKQQICQVHACDRMIGMVLDGFPINPAGGVDRADVRQQVSELVEGAEVGRRPSQDCDQGLSRIRPPVEGSEQDRALDFSCDGVVFSALARQQVVELLQSRFPRQPERPVMIAAANAVRDWRILFRSGHGARRLSLDGFRSCHYLPIRRKHPRPSIVPAASSDGLIFPIRSWKRMETNFLPGGVQRRPRQRASRVPPDEAKLAASASPRALDERQANVCHRNWRFRANLWPRAALRAAFAAFALPAQDRICRPHQPSSRI
jgi:hypothetical protein